MSLHIGVDPATGAPVLLPADALLRHVVILGATGSGKTVLGKAIVEEAVRAGIPCIAVDAQGDLASLALVHTPESAAKHRAPSGAVEGYWSRAAPAIFTPGSSRGTPVSLNPLRHPPAAETEEDAVLYVDAIAEALVAAMGYDPASDVGGRAKDVVYLALRDGLRPGPWPEDLAALARALEATPRGEAATLLTARERAALVRRARALTVGAKGLLYTSGEPLDIDAMLAWAPPGRTPVNIVYTGGLRSAAERELVVATLCEEVFRWMVARPSGELRLVLYIDEVAGLCPPHPRNPPAKKFLSVLFRQARKYGVGLVVSTQNVTDLDYKALGQANTWALGRVIAKQDLDRVRHLVASLAPGRADAVLEAVPGLRAGQFLLLSPDHLATAQALEVRGLATRHTVVPEERFREVVSTHAMALPEPAPDEATRRRMRLVANAVRSSMSAVPAAAEESIGMRVLRIFEDLPALYGPDEIAAMTGADPRFVGILLRKLADARLLRAERFAGRDVYWDPVRGFDPRRGAPGTIARLPLRVPLVDATRILVDRVRKRLLVFADETIRRTDFYHVPLWRVEADVPPGRKDGRVTRTFYVNGVTGEIAHVADGSLAFDGVPGTRVRELEPLAHRADLEHVPSGAISEPIAVAKAGPSQAEEIVLRAFGAKPAGEWPELVLLPVWRFELASRSDGRTRRVWVDGYLGSVLRAPPEGL
jgi:hypothetical protein